MGTFNFGALPEGVIQNAVPTAVAERGQSQMSLTQILDQEIRGMLETETGRRRQLLPLVAKSEARLHYLARLTRPLTKPERAEERAVDKWQRYIYVLFRAKNALPEFQQVVIATQRAVEAAERGVEAQQPAVAEQAMTPVKNWKQYVPNAAQLDMMAANASRVTSGLWTRDHIEGQVASILRRDPSAALIVILQRRARAYFLNQKHLRGKATPAEVKEYGELQRTGDLEFTVVEQAGLTRVWRAAMPQLTKRLDRMFTVPEPAGPTPAARAGLTLSQAQIQYSVSQARSTFADLSAVEDYVRNRLAQGWVTSPMETLAGTAARMARRFYLARKTRTPEEQREIDKLHELAYEERTIANAAGYLVAYDRLAVQLITVFDSGGQATTPTKAQLTRTQKQHAALRARPEDIEEALARRQEPLPTTDFDAEQIRATYEALFETRPLDALRAYARVKARINWLESAVGLSPERRGEENYLRDELRIARMVAAETGYADGVIAIIDQLRLGAAAAAPAPAPAPAPPAPSTEPVTMERVYKTLRKAVEAKESVEERQAAEQYLRRMFTGSWTRHKDRRYVGSIFASKPDPLGRHVLVDCSTSYGTGSGGTYITCYVAGAQKRENLTDQAVLVGGGYSEERLKLLDGKNYSRSHTPDGVSIEGAGLGFVLYSAHALTGYVMRGAEGCYSQEGHRSESAENWWKKAVVPRPGSPAYAQRLKNVRRPGGYKTHCEPIRSRILRDRDLQPQPNKGRISAQEKVVCESVDMEYSIEQEAYDVLTAEAVMKTGFVAFGLIAPGDRTTLPLQSAHKAFWDEAQPKVYPDERHANEVKTDIFYNSGRNSVYRRSADGDITYAMTKTRAELFSVSFHGPSPILTAIILNLLAKNYEDQAVGYVMRPDIAAVLAGNKVLARLVAKRSLALPGLQGLSKSAHREICSALNGVGQGPLRIDVEKDNPLNLPKLSAETKAMVAQYSRFD